MNDNLALLIANFTAEKAWPIVFGLLLFHFLKDKPLEVLAYFTSRRDKDPEMAKILLEFDKVGPECHDQMREHLQRHAFRKYFGIDAGPKMRRAIFSFFERNEHLVGWRELQLAFPHFKLNENLNLSVILTLSDRLAYLFSRGVCAYLTLPLLNVPLNRAG